MSEACSIQSVRTTWPRMSSPRICFAFSSASAGSSASLIPPALPRPPVSTCALTTTGPAELLGRGARLLRRLRRPPLRDGDAEALEELLALILVEVQSDRDSSCVDWPGAPNPLPARARPGARRLRHRRERRRAAPAAPRGRAAAGRARLARVPSRPSRGAARLRGGDARRHEGRLVGRRSPSSTEPTSASRSRPARATTASA